jgi:hypothetical protein
LAKAGVAGDEWILPDRHQHAGVTGRRLAAAASISASSRQHQARLRRARPPRRDGSRPASRTDRRDRAPRPDPDALERGSAASWCRTRRPDHDVGALRGDRLDAQATNEPIFGRLRTSGGSRRTSRRRRPADRRARASRSPTTRRHDARRRWSDGRRRGQAPPRRAPGPHDGISAHSITIVVPRRQRIGSARAVRADARRSRARSDSVADR